MDEEGVKMKGAGKAQNFTTKNVFARRNHSPDTGAKTHRGGRKYPFVRCSICKSQVTRQGYHAHNFIQHEGKAQLEEVM